MNQKDLLDMFSELIYDCDIETYELLYANESVQKLMGSTDYLHKKCYQLLQHKNSPSEFCTNTLLSAKEYYIWEHINPITGRYYILKDKLIEWDGNPCPCRDSSRHNGKRDP